VSARVREILAAIARVVCPPELEALGVIDGVLEDVEAAMDAMPPLVRVALVAGIAGFDTASMAVPRHLGRRFARLPADRASDYFESWWRSRIGLQREFARGVKGLLCMAYYEMQPVKDQLGYTPEQWIDRVKKRRLAIYSADIATHERRITEPDPLPFSVTASAREAG